MSEEVVVVELTRCPECGLLAEVVGRDVWPSTDGPVEHVHVRCVARHRFLLPVAMLAAHLPPEPVVAERRAPSAPGLQQP